MTNADSAANSLIFRCPKTDKDFDSGFQIGPDDLRRISPDYKMTVRCKSCFETHEFRFSESRSLGTLAKGK